MKFVSELKAKANTKGKKCEKNRVSITNLITLLKAVVIGDCADEDIIGCLGSQRSLCRYGNPSLGIYPMSLNTMKVIAESLQKDTYALLDDLRKKALSLSQLGADIPKASVHSSKASFLAQISKLKNENSVMRQDLVIDVAQANRAMRRMVSFGRLANKEDLACKEFGEIMTCLNLVRSIEEVQ